MIKQALDTIDKQESILIKEIPDDNRRILRDEIGLLRVREGHLLGTLNMLEAASRTSPTDMAIVDRIIRTHAEFTDVQAHMLRAIISLHMTDTGIDNHDIEQWRDILGNNDPE